jgi:hypothetical protein
LARKFYFLGIDDLLEFWLTQKIDNIFRAHPFQPENFRVAYLMKEIKILDDIELNKILRCNQLSIFTKQIRPCITKELSIKKTSDRILPDIP